MSQGLEAYRARVSEQKRKSILQTARETFSTKGFHDGAMKQIANDANCSTATLYKHVGSKEVLFDMVVEQEKLRRGQTGVNALVARIAFAGVCALADDAATSTQDAISVLGDFVASLENAPQTDEAA